MPYDFWLSSARLRWGAGRLDMEEAIARHAYARTGAEAVTIVRRPQSEEARATGASPVKSCESVSG